MSGILANFNCGVPRQPGFHTDSVESMSSEQFSQVVSVLSLSFVILERIETVEASLWSGLYELKTFETAARGCKREILNLLCAMKIQTTRRISLNSSQVIDNIPNCLLGELNDGCYYTQAYVFLKDASHYIERLRDMLASKQAEMGIRNFF